MSPEDVVKKQLDAYNTKDIDAFTGVWLEGAQYFAHPSTLLANGAAANPQRHVVLGSTVVDHERVSRTFPEGPGTVEVVAKRSPKPGSSSDLGVEVAALAGFYSSTFSSSRTTVLSTSMRAKFLSFAGTTVHGADTVCVRCSMSSTAASWAFHFSRFRQSSAVIL